MQSFSKVFNDVFVKEKPQVCHKYFLTEVGIFELDTRDEYAQQMNHCFRWNFNSGTSKEADYLKSPALKAFMLRCLKSLKAEEGEKIMSFSSYLKKDPDRDTEGCIPVKGVKPTPELSNNGREFFFSNVLMKVYQVPTLFLHNSDEDYSPYESSYICLFYEKSMRKRTWAKSQT